VSGVRCQDKDGFRCQAKGAGHRAQGEAELKKPSLSEVVEGVRNSEVGMRNAENKKRRRAYRFKVQGSEVEKIAPLRVRSDNPER